MVSKHFFVQSLLALIMAAGLLAQEAQIQVEQVSEGRPKRVFTCLYWEGTPKESLYYRMGEEFIPIEFKDSKRSRDYALKRLADFELYRDAEEPKKGKPPYDLLAKTSIPTGSNRVLFLVIPFQLKDKPSMTYRVLAMDDSLSAFPLGTFRFVNFTQQPLLVRFADATQKIAAAKMTVMSCKAGKAGGFRPFVIGTTKGKQIFGTKLFGQPSGRELVFISPPERKENDTPRVKFITDIRGAISPGEQ